MILRLIPLITAYLPIIGIHLSYLVAMNAGHVQECIPYLDGCVTISATGRYPPSSHFFKATLLPQSVFLAVYWGFAVAWLRALNGNSAKPLTLMECAIGSIGFGGAFFLILYVTFLGTYDDFYTVMRLFGVYFYFLLTVLAQLLLVLQVRKYARDSLFKRYTNIQLLLCTAPFVLGAINLTLKATLDDSAAIEARIEWAVSMMMQLYFIAAYYTWKHTGFGAKYTVERGSWS